MIYEKSKKVILNEDMLMLVDELFEKFNNEPDELVVFMQIIMDREKRYNLKNKWNYQYLMKYPAFKKFLRDEQQRRATSRYLQKKQKEREE